MRAGEFANRLTPTVDGFGLAGVSNHPDPTTHAYRKDLADTALAFLDLEALTGACEPLVQ